MRAIHQTMAALAEVNDLGQSSFVHPIRHCACQASLSFPATMLTLQGPGAFQPNTVLPTPVSPVLCNQDPGWTVHH